MQKISGEKVRQVIEEMAKWDWDCYIPAHTVQTLVNYAEHGWQPGTFITAVLENNLAMAASSADAENRRYLANIAMVVELTGLNRLYQSSKPLELQPTR